MLLTLLHLLILSSLHNIVLAACPLRIFCLGDSLTWGENATPNATPYATTTREVLEEQWDGDVLVDYDGKGGDAVWETYMDRLAARVNAVTEPYTHIIILGGTNDLSRENYTLSQTSSALEAVWAKAAETSEVVAVTVPDSTRLNGSVTGFEVKRGELNGFIRGAGLPLYDLDAILPYSAMSPEDQQKYYNADGIHFTPAGYELFGQGVAEKVLELAGGMVC